MWVADLCVKELLSPSLHCREHFVALPCVLLAHEKVHTLILAGDWKGDLDCLPGNWTRVGGNGSWLRECHKYGSDELVYKICHK